MPQPSKRVHQNCKEFCVLSWDKGVFLLKFWCEEGLMGVGKKEWRGLKQIRPSEFYSDGLHPSLTTDSHVTVM